MTSRDSRDTDEIRRIFETRLAVLERILRLGEKALPDMDAALQKPSWVPVSTAKRRCGSI